MPRPSWKGFVRISLVSVPVEGYTASATGESQIALNQLHRECGERIRYRKTCPVHGEVTQGEIVMGYQYERDQYIVVDPAELDELRTDADRSINVDRFVDWGAIDARYFAGRTYYLLPSGRAGAKPYSLLQQAMSDEQVIGLAQAVISSREQLVALRPIGKLLAASILNYSADVKPVEEFEKLLESEPASTQELKLAKTLIAATRADDAELGEYHDLYAERLRELVDAKFAGRKIAKPRAGKVPQTINLIDALKASLDFKSTRAASGAKNSSRSTAARTRRASPAKKRKTG
jgi:DNA end-binding protein Ku